MGNTFYFEWEVKLMELIQSHIGGFGTSIASLCSAFGEEFLMVAVLGLLYWCLDKKWGKYLAANVLVGVTYTSMLKNVVLRRRPYFDNPGVKCLKPLEKDADLYDIAAQGYSFPSTHSTNAVTTYASLAVYKKSKVLSIISVVIILLVGISRFSLGVHYPTDVMVGWLCGVLIIYLIPFIHSKISKDWIFYLVLVVLALPGVFFCNSNDFYSGLGLMVGVFGGFVFEERYVNFEKVKGFLPNALRFIVGIAIFGGLNVALKLPFSKEFLESGTMASFMVRTIRYAFETFIVVGVYPMIFKVVEKKTN